MGVPVFPLSQWQGAERDVFILQTVNFDENDSRLGALTFEHSVRIAMTRAVDLLVVVCDERISYGREWRKIWKYCDDCGAVKDAELLIQNIRSNQLKEEDIVIEFE